MRGTLDASPDGVPDAGPLPCVEVARTGSPVEAELAGTAFQQVSGHDRSEPLPVPPREKCLVVTVIAFPNERLGPAVDPKQASVRCRRRSEDGARA